MPTSTAHAGEGGGEFAGYPGSGSIGQLHRKRRHHDQHEERHGDRAAGVADDGADAGSERAPAAPANAEAAIDLRHAAGGTRNP